MRSQLNRCSDRWEVARWGHNPSMGLRVLRCRNDPGLFGEDAWPSERHEGFAKRRGARKGNRRGAEENERSAARPKCTGHHQHLSRHLGGMRFAPSKFCGQKQEMPPLSIAVQECFEFECTSNLSCRKDHGFQDDTDEGWRRSASAGTEP